MTEALSPELDKPSELKMATTDVDFDAEADAVAAIEMAEGFDFLLALNHRHVNIFGGIDPEVKLKRRAKGKLAKKARKANRPR